MDKRRISPDIETESHAMIKKVATEENRAVNFIAARILNDWAESRNKKAKPKSKAVAVSNDEPVNEVWEYWKEIHNAPDEKLSPTRVKLIKKSINDHGSQKVKNAILGITRDDWYMSKGLNSINQILKNEENIFKFSNNVGANADARFKVIASQSKSKLNPLDQVQQAIEARRGQTSDVDGQVLEGNDGNLFD
jgi:hypothetical protein